MRIIIVCVLISCLISITSSAKIKEDREKRNVAYQISHPYRVPSYRLERRISSGPHQYQNPSQIYSRPYHKGRPYSHPIPPYAVQMEPLVHYSQRDPLYDTNILSLDPHNDDLLTENNHIQDNVDRYGYHKPHIVERPVYIKEPEPIIEIIIKESNVSLPAPPPPPPPPKKKKEQVQVFYVKYQKNPHGTGKESILYDKPVPAITPKVPNDHEEEEEPASYDYLPESATAPPPPSTTLRTIIKPDSEVYHSPSGVKVTFGKEGFDYDKRSSKPEDYVPQQSTQFPQGRQLTSFSNAYFKRPTSNQNYQSFTPGFTRSDVTQPQTYRTINFPPNNPSSNYKPFGRPTQYQQQPKNYQGSQFSRPNPDFNNHPSQPPSPPQFSHTISHPPPVRYQNPRPTPLPARQPVPYKPFEHFRAQQNIPPSAPVSSPVPQQSVQFRPETHFPSRQQLPFTHQSHTFNPTRFSQPLNSPYNSREIAGNSNQHINPSQNLPQFPNQHQQSQHQYQQVNNVQQQSLQQHQNLATQAQAVSQQAVNPHRIHQNRHQNNQNYQHSQGVIQNEHLNNIQAVQNILPPGGQLIQSVPKYEQHISSIESPFPQQAQGLTPQQYQEKIIQQFHQNSAELDFQQQGDITEHQRNVIEERQRQNQHQQQLNQFYEQNPDIQQRSQRNQASSTPRSDVYSSTRKTGSTTTRIYYQTTTAAPSSTSTKEPETPSTTTKDPKILEAQLPDEVPAELREQLLSSGILNNADISVLDYDKVGDIPLSALPPDQLANFYGAGGAAQLASGSEPVPSVLRPEAAPLVSSRLSDNEGDAESAASESEEVTVPAPGVNVKVVKYNPDTEDGQTVQNKYVDLERAHQVDPVVLNDSTYNRYLPLKVNGTQFPIPHVPELKGKRISSVVVLAPVNYDFSSERKTRQTSRQVSTKSSDIELIEGTALKDLLNNPSSENYRRFLDSENNTRSDKQSVILLVADSLENGKEIYMYDVGTQTVSKLSGELSSAFVEAAEANSEDDTQHVAASNTIETRVAYREAIDRHDVDEDELVGSASDIEESKIPVIDPLQDEDMDTDASDNLEKFVDISGHPVDDLSSSDLDWNYEEKTGHS